MTELLTKILESVGRWPPERQDEAAELLVRLAERDEPPLPLDAEVRALLDQSKAAVRRGEFATDADVEAAFRRFRT
jgi:hypothetical protein